MLVESKKPLSAQFSASERTIYHHATLVHMETINRKEEVPFNLDSEPYIEPLSDRKLFLSERLNRLERWQRENVQPTNTTQPVVDAILRLQQLAQPLWNNHAHYYTPEQIDLLGQCHVMASDIQTQLVHLATKVSKNGSTKQP